MKQTRIGIQIIAILALFVLLILAGVFSPKNKQDFSQEDDQSLIPQIQTSITSSTWVWQRTQMNDDSVRLPSTPGAFTLTFLSDGTLTGTTDCNSFFGQYSTEDKMITFGPFGSTMMFCENSSEQVFMRDVESSNRIFFTEEGNLVLLLPYDSGSIIFEKKQ